MMQENNLLNGNSTNDIQGVKSTYALVILISSIETENQLSYCGLTIVLVYWKDIIAPSVSIFMIKLNDSVTFT